MTLLLNFSKKTKVNTPTDVPGHHVASDQQKNAVDLPALFVKVVLALTFPSCPGYSHPKLNSRICLTSDTLDLGTELGSSGFAPGCCPGHSLYSPSGFSCSWLLQELTLTELFWFLGSRPSIVYWKKPCMGRSVI